MKGSKKSRLFLLVLLAIMLVAPAIPQVQGAEGDYTDIHWPIAGAILSYGMGTDGNFIWVTDDTGDEVYKYTMEGVYTTIHWDTGLNDMPRGLTTDGVNIWIADKADDRVYKYAMDGTPITSWALTGANDDPWSLTTDGVNIWVTDNIDDKVYKYNMVGGYIESFTTLPHVPNPLAIDTDGTNIWLVEYGIDVVYKLDMDGAFTGYNWSVAVESNNPTGLCNNGTYFWILDVADDEVYLYEGPSPPIYPPSDPDLLFGAGFNASSPYVELHWNHSLVDVQFFEVQNSSDAESWTYLGQSTTANYTDTQVVNGTMRYYKVRAYNQTGGTWYNSSFSDVNFDMVYFIMAGANGDGAPPVDDYSTIFLAIGLILMLSIAFLYVKTR